MILPFKCDGSYADSHIKIRAPIIRSSLTVNYGQKAALVRLVRQLPLAFSIRFFGVSKRPAVIIVPGLSTPLCT